MKAARPIPKSRKMQEQNAQQETAAGDKSLEELLAEAQAKIEEQRESMMRALAESENLRKRTQAEALASQKYAIERFAESLLPVVDSLEAALAAASTQDAAEHAQPLREGTELTLKQLKTAFQKANVFEVAPAPGDRFDPHRHQAMATVPSEAEPNTVAGVMQKGYLLHDRVLRPALVTVARAVEKPAGNPISDTDLDQ